VHIGIVISKSRKYRLSVTLTLKTSLVVKNLLRIALYLAFLYKKRRAVYTEYLNLLIFGVPESLIQSRTIAVSFLPSTFYTLMVYCTVFSYFSDIVLYVASYCLYGCGVPATCPWPLPAFEGALKLIVIEMSIDRADSVRGWKVMYSHLWQSALKPGFEI